jgi:hypothetical protein
VKNQAKCCLCKQGPYRPTSPFRDCFSLHMRWTRNLLWLTKTIVFSFSLLTHRLDMVVMADGCGYRFVHACFAQNLWTAANSEKLWKICKIWWNHKLRVCLLHDVWTLYGVDSPGIFLLALSFDLLPTCIVLFSWWTPFLKCSNLINMLNISSLTWSIWALAKHLSLMLWY